jgi:light-regulated signal transduction histidine kinase (bacteriophytochrome)
VYQAIVEAHNRISGVTIMATDITEQVIARKKIEESEKKYRELTESLEHIVTERTEELRRSNDDLQQFAHVASHDLKEPVRKIKTFIGRLQDEYGDLLPEKGRQYVSKMQNASERMDDMIEGVLKYSSLNETEQTMNIIDLNEVIANIEEDLEVVIEQKKAVIKKDNLPELRGAPVLIYQLFYNLIYNSLKFSKQGEQPLIAVSSSELRQHDQTFAKITIADNGIGFDKEYAEVIFDTFTRLNSKDRYEGTGLGLALCKKIAERHQGSISASGSKGKGALFTILLPVVQIEKSI